MFKSKGYIYPETLVDGEWVQAHLSDHTVRLIEMDADSTAYRQGHIPGAIGFNWQNDLQNRVIRAPISKGQLEALLSRIGVSNDTTIALYGDHNNWFAAWTFWILKYYGHRDVRLLDGGRGKWLADKREITTQVPLYPPTIYTAQAPRNTLRAFRDRVLLSLGCSESVLLDVRSPGEYSGQALALTDRDEEEVERAGHIPGAINIPWSMAVQEDGTFKPAAELRMLYADHGVTPDKEVIVYCRIGERSSHTWFVLHSLLGYTHVRHYDGSWAEWGSLIGAPIEK